MLAPGMQPTSLGVFLAAGTVRLVVIVCDLPDSHLDAHPPAPGTGKRTCTRPETILGVVGKPALSGRLGHETLPELTFQLR